VKERPGKERKKREKRREEKKWMKRAEKPPMRTQAEPKQVSSC
jgi:hypothetical protein